LVRLEETKPRHVVLDPMCGAGTILAEHLVATDKVRGDKGAVLGGDVEFAAVRSAATNLRKLGAAQLARWDATRLPLEAASVDRVVSTPPFGKQLSDPEAIGPLYQDMVREHDRVLRPGGRAV